MLAGQCHFATALARVASASLSARRIVWASLMSLKFGDLSHRSRVCLSVSLVLGPPQSADLFNTIITIIAVRVEYWRCWRHTRRLPPRVPKSGKTKFHEGSGTVSKPRLGMWGHCIKGCHSVYSNPIVQQKVSSPTMKVISLHEIEHTQGTVQLINRKSRSGSPPLLLPIHGR